MNLFAGVTGRGRRQPRWSSPWEAGGRRSGVSCAAVATARLRCCSALQAHPQDVLSPVLPPLSWPHCPARRTIQRPSASKFTWPDEICGVVVLAPAATSLVVVVAALTGAVVAQAPQPRDVEDYNLVIAFALLNARKGANTKIKLIKLNYCQPARIAKAQLAKKQ